MSNAHDQTFAVAAGTSIAAGRAVVRTNANNACALPAGANAAGFLGITVGPNTRAGAAVAVRRSGVARATAADAIPRGARVCIADNQGRIAAATNPTYTLGAGTLNSTIVLEWIHPASWSLNTRVRLHNGGNNQTFGWSLDAGELRIHVVTAADGAITSTPGSLTAAIAADPVLSTILRPSLPPGGNGSAVVVATVATPTAVVTSLNAIGIAENEANSAGEIIDVFINPNA